MCTAIVGGHTCVCNPGYSEDGVTSCVGSVRCWGSVNDPVILNPPSDLGKVTAVSSSKASIFTCAIQASSSTVKYWGRQTHPNLKVLVPTDFGKVKEVSVGSFGACALTTAGAVRCWGTVVEQGDSYVFAAPTELTSKLSTKTVSVAEEFGCAITAAGAAFEWGGNAYSAGRPPACQRRAVHLLRHRQRLRRDGRGALRCFGRNGQTNKSTVPADLQNVQAKAVSAGSKHTCAVLLDGSVRCFGAPAFAPGYVPSDLGAVKMVAASDANATAVTGSGGVRLFPDAAGGPYGPVPGDLGPVVAVTLGKTHACAIIDG